MVRCTVYGERATGPKHRKDKKLAVLAKDVKTSQLAEVEGEVRIWALSDIHTDKAENMKWIEGLSPAEQLDTIWQVTLLKVLVFESEVPSLSLRVATRNFVVTSSKPKVSQ